MHYGGNCNHHDSGQPFECAACGAGPEPLEDIHLPCPHEQGRQSGEPLTLEQRHEAALNLIVHQQQQLAGLREAVRSGMMTEFKALFHHTHEKSLMRLDAVLDLCFKNPPQQ
jgi:hypothetical protein